MSYCCLSNNLSNSSTQDILPCWLRNWSKLVSCVHPYTTRLNDAELTEINYMKDNLENLHLILTDTVDTAHVLSRILQLGELRHTGHIILGIRHCREAEEVDQEQPHLVQGSPVLRVRQYLHNTPETSPAQFKMNNCHLQYLPNVVPDIIFSSSSEKTSNLLSLIQSRTEVARLLCMSINLFFSSNSDRLNTTLVSLAVSKLRLHFPPFL